MDRDQPKRGPRHDRRDHVEEPQSGDECATWSRAQLLSMDARFCAAMRLARGINDGARAKRIEATDPATDGADRPLREPRAFEKRPPVAEEKDLGL
jgi:hypothetical protein